VEHIIINGVMKVKKFKDKFKRIWAFLLAAAFAPVAYLFNGYCTGASCIGCPASMGCSVGFPFIVVTIILINSRNKIFNLFKKHNSLTSE
jgi:hypothetical protein